MTDSWTIRLPYTTPPLTLNGRLHWATKARITREVRGCSRMSGFFASAGALAVGFIFGHYVFGFDNWPMFYGALIAAVVFGAAEGLRR